MCLSMLCVYIYSRVVCVLDRIATPRSYSLEDGVAGHRNNAAGDDG